MVGFQRITRTDESTAWGRPLVPRDGVIGMVAIETRS